MNTGIKEKKYTSLQVLCRNEEFVLVRSPLYALSRINSPKEQEQVMVSISDNFIFIVTLCSLLPVNIDKAVTDPNWLVALH